MYRLIVETLLGLRLKWTNAAEPRLPRAWESFKIHYRHRARFTISPKRASGEVTPPILVIVDGQSNPTLRFTWR
jgi:cellobiose phosphorylase